MMGGEDINIKRELPKPNPILKYELNKNIAKRIENKMMGGEDINIKRELPKPN
jgi:hypothetical protein